MPVLNTTQTDTLNEPMFFGSALNIARYDVVKYPIFEKLTQQQLGFFWRPEEVSLTQDNRDFKNQPELVTRIFTENLKYQILLDSVQGRSPLLAILPYVSLPELEACIIAWSFYESLHSRSYTHIIRNVYNDPSVVFDNIITNPEILKRAKDVTKHYDDFIEYQTMINNYGFGLVYINDIEYDLNEYDRHKKLLLMLVAINALEGVRFYVSFCCAFAFAELRLFDGNANIVELIARDENVHLGIVQNIIKLYRAENPLFNQVFLENVDLLYVLYDQVVEQEKEWANYLFRDGVSMIGLNAELLCQYVEYIANKRMKTIGLKSVYSQKTNPCSWIDTYLKSGNKQSAPQETNIVSYLTSALDSNIDVSDFSNFSL